MKTKASGSDLQSLLCISLSRKKAGGVAAARSPRVPDARWYEGCSCRTRSGCRLNVRFARKRTSIRALAMSHKCQSATFRQSLDQIIRERDNCRRHSDVELLGALDVDGQFECGRLVASVGRPFEIVAGVSIGITKDADKPWRYGLKGSRSLSKPFRRSNRRSRPLMSMIFFSENRYPLFQIML